MAYLGFPRWGTAPEYGAKTYYYRPQRSCGQGYVFTRVCDSVNRGVLRRTSRDQADPPRTKENPPGTRHPPTAKENPPWDQGEPPQTRHTPPGPRRTPPGPRRPPQDQAHPPGPRRTPPEPGTPPGKNTAAYGLLECILVWENFCRKLHAKERNWALVSSYIRQ